MERERLETENDTLRAKLEQCQLALTRLQASHASVIEDVHTPRRRQDGNDTIDLQTPVSAIRFSPACPPSSGAALNAFSAVALPEIRAIKQALDQERQVTRLPVCIPCSFS